MIVEQLKRKIVLLGDGAVGKTSLIRKFVMDRFDDDYITTIGTKVMKKDVRVDDERITLMIWDILGQKDYNRLQSSSFVGSYGAIFVIDRTRAGTLDSVRDYWVPRFREVVPLGVFVLAANKSDLVDDIEVTEEDVADLSKEMDAPYFLSSAKTGANVEVMFSDMAKRCMGRAAVSIAPPDRDITNLTEAADAVIVDFCSGLGDQNDAMPYVRRQCERTGLDIKDPTSEALRDFVESLESVDAMFMPPEKAHANKVRRLGFIKKGEKGEAT